MADITIQGSPLAQPESLLSGFETMIQTTLTPAGSAWFSQIEPVAKAMIEGIVGPVEWTATGSGSGSVVHYAALQLILEYFIAQRDPESANLKRYTAGEITYEYADSLRSPLSWRELLADYRRDTLASTGSPGPKALPFYLRRY